MSYDPDRIEIKSCGEVVRGGIVVGTITFNGLVGQVHAVGEHWTEEVGPDVLGEMEDAKDKADESERELKALRDGVIKLIKDIEDAPCTFSINDITTGLEELLP